MDSFFPRLPKLKNKTLALDALWRTMGIVMQIITLCPSGQLQILNCWNRTQIWHNSSATQPVHSYFLEGMLFIPYTKNGAKSLSSYVQVSIHLGCICATPGNKWNKSVNCKCYPWNIITLLKIWKATCSHIRSVSQLCCLASMQWAELRIPRLTKAQDLNHFKQ